MPERYGLGLWKTLWEPGDAHGRRGGYRGDSTRCGSRRATALGTDITPMNRRLQSGL